MLYRWSDAPAVVRIFRKADGSLPVLEWLDLLEERRPKAYAKCLERILALASYGHELRRPLSDYLRDGVHELRAKEGTVQYRMLYGYQGKNDAVLVHALTKEAKIDPRDIDLAVERMALVRRDPEKYTADFDV